MPKEYLWFQSEFTRRGNQKQDWTITRVPCVGRGAQAELTWLITWMHIQGWSPSSVCCVGKASRRKVTLRRTQGFTQEKDPTSVTCVRQLLTSHHHWKCTNKRYTVNITLLHSRDDETKHSKHHSSTVLMKTYTANITLLHSRDDETKHNKHHTPPQSWWWNQTANITLLHSRDDGTKHSKNHASPQWWWNAMLRPMSEKGQFYQWGYSSMYSQSLLYLETKYQNMNISILRLFSLSVEL